MRKISYNQIKFARIKSAILGVLIMIQGLTFIYSFSVADKMNVMVVIFTTLLPLMALILSLRFSFGQKLEVGDSEEFETYIEFGSLKWNTKKYFQLKRLAIEQSDDRYYWITVEHSTGQKLVLEKYPTLDKAMLRLNEFRSVIDK